MIKTFRGLIAANGQDTIVLHTNDGSTGYRIVNFQVMNKQPGTVSAEGVVKIYKVPQSSVDRNVDFSDNTLLAVCYYQDDDNAAYPITNIVIFDTEIFNQDIYVTAGVAGSEAMNYYIELEQVKLDLNESTVATLKNLKNLEPGG